MYLQMASEVVTPEQGEAEGCIQCQIGSKLVLFVTGKCHWGCDYCPLSDNRRETPDMFANERRCSNFSEVIEEAKAMKATGTGITGGDPMLDFDKTVEAISVLKKEFGPEHHIHCYTSIPIKPRQAEKLGEVGLDELRFHLLDLKIDRYRDSIDAASKSGVCVGIELPAEPDKEKQLFELIDSIQGTNIDFLNINELEITVGNQENMDVRGFNLAGGITAAAEGSAELAFRLKQAASEYDYHLKFCTANYKDAGQLRNRFRRRGEATLRPYEVLSDDDTILFGAIPCDLEDASDDVNELKEFLGLNEGWIRYNGQNQQIEFPLSAAEDIAAVVEVPVMMVEVHPTHERLEVGSVYLNQNR
ncbi:MAG: radical SAM protein [Methanobacteriota archaeon]|nr:MAG: radical SAM protein [Euryarchaeota archaeon]